MASDRPKNDDRILDCREATLSDLDAGRRFYVECDGERGVFALPSFLIIGVQKGGTREMHTWLSQHPAMRGARIELDFFDTRNDLEKEWSEYLCTEEFRVLESDSEPKIFFEKTPSYFDGRGLGSPDEVPNMVRKVLPSGKFILCLRNPTDRAYSRYQMQARQRDNPRRARSQIEHLRRHPAGFMQRRYDSRLRQTDDQKPLRTFSELLDDFLHMEQNSAARGGDHRAIRLLDRFLRGDKKATERKYSIDYGIFLRGHYAKYLEAWLDVFARDQMFITTLEHWIEHPFDVMEDMQRFLGVPPIDYRTLSCRNERGFWVLKDQHSKGNAEPYPPIESADRERLDEHYRPWNERLRAMIPEVPIPW